MSISVLIGFDEAISTLMQFAEGLTAQCVDLTLGGSTFTAEDSLDLDNRKYKSENTMWLGKDMRIAVLTIAGIVFACGPAPKPDVLHGEGVVQKVIVADRRIVVAHEDISDFMDAMTMSFEVNKPHLLQKFKSGDHIRFTLERTKLTLYLVEADKITTRTDVNAASKD